jgi:UDP-glucose 4-epimerase
MKKAVVIGGSGFIGLYTVEQLLSEGNSVTIIDSAYNKVVNNIINTHGSHKIKHVIGSANDIFLLEKYFRNVDYVYYLAANTCPLDNNWPFYYQSNVNAVLNVLQTAKNSEVKKVLLASSSAVYGNNTSSPNREDIIPEPISPYGITKLIAEYYFKIYNDFHNLPTISLRYFNVYGPRQNPNSPFASVIPKFIKNISIGQSPVIFGDGEQKRDFVFVKDVAQANVLAASSDATGIYNIGFGKSTSINDLCQLLFKLMHTNAIKPMYQADKAGGIKNSLADITRAKAFGYAPIYDLESGLRETIEGFK